MKQKLRTALQAVLALGLGAGLAALLRWYYDVYVYWQPQAFPLAVAALGVGVLALTLLTLWARGERKLLRYLWKALLSVVVFMVLLIGVSAVINNVLGHSAMAKEAAAVALPLCCVQILALYSFMLKKTPGALKITLSVILSAGVLYAGFLAWQGGREAAASVRFAFIKVNMAEEAMKTRPTVYTPEKRAAMQENAVGEQFAAQTQEIIAKADVYAENIDTLRDMVVAEGLPRYYFVGSQRDPDRHLCKYCGTNLWEEYGRYSWLTDPFGYPWKIQCPACERRFPSNDFAGYYKLGLDERGVFQPAQAKEKNDALVAQGEGGYLKNILYPEKGEGWGVDDGFGYYTGRVFENGEAERHTYIAYYIHDGVWGGARWHDDSVRAALLALKDAYLYTGDEKYGRAGAALLGRIADFYPDFDWSLWNDVRGFSASGTILDVVWGNYVASDFCLAYDAFFPVMDEETRLHVENNILRAVYRFAAGGQLRGNFGITQQTVAAAAVVLDTMPETGEWLDWVMASGGGGVAQKLIDVVDRDGMGDEAAPNYNSIWVDYLIDMAELLEDYGTYPSADLYENPKFVQMLYAQVPVVLANYYTAQIGDGGLTANPGFTLSTKLAMTAFRFTSDPVFAQFLYLANGNSAEGLSEGIGVKHPLQIQQDVLRVIEEHGELCLPSQMMAGYGFAALRQSPRSDFWMYFGITSGHGHMDSLNLGIDAYGLNMAPELGYPEDTANNPNGAQWSNATLSHNTVMVDGQVQLKNRGVKQGRPLHFDDAGRVKVMDVDAGAAYAQTSEYRRTVVMIEVDEQVSYGVDFFRVKGGNEHIYSFHSQSDEIFATENLTLAPQKTGTYAGPDVPWGKDPGTVDTRVDYSDLQYPAGFSWLDQVRRAKAPAGGFAVDFAVKDFWGVLEDSEGLHLRMTQLNDFAPDEVAVARGYPPKLAGNPEYLEYVLVRRAGKNLDSLFTTVFEPYRDTRYIETIEGASGAVIVTHTSGRVDEITYDEGRVSVEIYAPDGELEYSYNNDAFAYTGRVVSFTKELSLENSITVKLDQPVDFEALAGKYIFVENDGRQNAAYRIEGARGVSGVGIVLDIGRVSPVRGLKNKTDLNKFIYNIKAGQRFRIPLPSIEDLR